MPKASSVNAWVGAPPVSEGAFAFAHGDFFAEASGQNRHRRATPQELKTHFTSGNDKDHPAHWFEAQLIHYGLQPSKTKSVARMRLFDAVNAGNLKVPADVTKIEGKLKKEWTKNDREAKKASKAASSTPAKAAGAKRKADDDAGPSKKAKTTTTKASTSKASTSKASTSKASTSKASTSKAPSATPAKKQTARRGGASSTPGRSTPATSQPSAPRERMARRGGISQGPTRASRQDSPESPPRKKQTARRSNAFMARGRIEAPPHRSSGYDFDAPPPYSQYPEDAGYRSDDYSPRGGYQSHSDNYDNDGYDDGYEDEASLAPLGLLNGDYEIDSEDVTSQWDYYHPDDFGLTLTLSGSSLWGRFNFGIYEGVFFIEDRPMRSSHDKVWFKWRGREDQGPIMYGDRNNGWIKFLGDGRIEGFLDAQSLSFQGRRFPDQPTRSRIDARSMKDEFDGYSEDEYERENRARW
ncbi:hypothetical protein NW755_011294 [Fusarium falciforme]|uniref:Uncharacterized protein n=1 Tax=Fusarium falciforme TaxID=195108 RepID=A0A9W8QXI7_9HYPO|nr:hypothetical protein NW755_011294 [Fusarium falciforme]KAJ4243725.1 hypothetical protein NW757_010939 [Fusarium falciforme]